MISHTLLLRHIHKNNYPLRLSFPNIDNLAGKRIFDLTLNGFIVSQLLATL